MDELQYISPHRIIFAEHEVPFLLGMGSESWSHIQDKTFPDAPRVMTYRMYRGGFVPDDEELDTFTYDPFLRYYHIEDLKEWADFHRSKHEARRKKIASLYEDKK